MSESNVIADAMKRLEQNKQDVKHKIEEQMNDIIEAVMKRSKQLIQQVDDLCQQKTEILTDQLTKLENSSVDIDLDVDNVIRMISCMGNVIDGDASVGKLFWEDVGGLENEKKQLIELLQYPLEYPEFFAKYSKTRKTRGMLLWGPPGCGKALLVNVAASKSRIMCHSVTGPELITKYGTNFIDNLFQKAMQSQPCMLFFDELDALVRSCNYTVRNIIINKLIVGMDNTAHDKRIWFLGATTSHLLDPLRKDIVHQLIKPGRFDKLMFVDLPDFPSRVSILKAVLRKTPVDPCVDWEFIAEQTHGYSGADLYEIGREATKLLIRSEVAKQCYHTCSCDCDCIFHEDTPFITMKLMRRALKNSKQSVKPTERERYMHIKMALDTNLDIGFDLNDKEIQQLLISRYIRENAINMRIPWEIIQLIRISYANIDLPPPLPKISTCDLQPVFHCDLQTDIEDDDSDIYD